jgi:hypothetical protein
MSDIDGRVTRTISTLTLIADRVTRFSGKLLLGVAVVSIGSFLLGLAALEGGIRNVWIVLGGAFGVIAVGAALIARWRIGGVRRQVPAIAAEVRTLLTEGRRDAVEVIEQFHGPAGGGERDSVIVVSRSMSGLRGVARHGLAGSEHLVKAVTAITTFPGLAAMAVLISIVFALLIPIFLLALAL